MPYSISVFAVIFNPFFLTGIYRLKIAKQDCVDEKRGELSFPSRSEHCPLFVVAGETQVAAGVLDPQELHTRILRVMDVMT